MAAVYSHSSTESEDPRLCLNLLARAAPDLDYAQLQSVRMAVETQQARRRGQKELHATTRSRWVQLYADLHEPWSLAWSARHNH